MTIITKTAAMMLAAALSLYAGTYSLDKSHSNVGFKVKHMMISNVTGNFGDYDGSFAIEDGKLTALNGTVKTASINTENEKRDNHLRSDDFFNAAKYPEMKMKLLSVKGDEAVVELTIRDVTKKVTMELDMGGEIVDPWGNQRAGLELTGKINRIDYGLKWNKLLEAGGVAVSEDVKIIVALQGIAQ